MSEKNRLELEQECLLKYSKAQMINKYIDELEENEKLHKELDYADNYNIYLIAKLDKIKEILGNYKHYSTPDEKQNAENEEIVDKVYELLEEIE